MDKQRTIFDFLGQVFTIYGITVVMLVVITKVIVGDEVNQSVMFPLGNQGIPNSTLLQFLLVSVMTNSIQSLFFTDRVIKNASKSVRTIGMLGAIFVVMCLFNFIFKWFPPNNITAWVLFITFFIVSFAISVLVVSVKEKLENRKMQEGLRKLQAQFEEVNKDGKH